MQFDDNAQLFRTPIIGVLSDIHIGNYRDDPKWHSIALDLAHWVRDEFSSRGIQDILIPGDVFHNRHEISVQTLNAAKQFFDVLSQFNVVVTIGNHDAYYRDRSDVNSLAVFDSWPNITVVDQPMLVEQWGTQFALCPWATDTDKLPPCDVVIGHFEFNGFNIAHHKVCTTGFDGGKLVSKCPMVITGHFHMADTRKYSNGAIHYLGTPYQLNWSEAGDDKFIYVLDLEKRRFMESIKNEGVTPTHIRAKFADWLAGGRKADPLLFNGNFVNAIIDQDVYKTIERDGESVQINDTVNVSQQFVAQLHAVGARDVRTTFAVSGGATADDREFDSIDIQSAFKEFVFQLDLEKKVREDVYKTLMSMYSITMTT